MPIPFIEVDGYKILEQVEILDPLVDSFLPFTCSKCKVRLSQFIEKAKKLAAISRVLLPETYYRYGFENCWKCHKQILVFTWPEHNLDDGLPEKPKKEPLPRTIQYRFSNTIKQSYWMNICPHCGSNQGDFYLYDEPDGPFFSFECGDDTIKSFNLDLTKIAWRNTRR
jgi:hypothetical protein